MNRNKNTELVNTKVEEVIKKLSQDIKHSSCGIT